MLVLFFIHMSILCYLFFFFQAEDGIRARDVTGVQTCALPIYGKNQVTVPVAFTSATIDPMTTIELQGRQSIISNIGDQSDEIEVICLCGTQWFQKLIDNPFVSTAYQYYASTQSPLRERLGGNRIYRDFVHKGVHFYEVISGYS